jgi:hypothetical protein
MSVQTQAVPKVFACNAGARLEETFHRVTLMPRGMIEHGAAQGLGKSLVELVKELQKALGRTALAPWPIAALGAQGQRPKIELLCGSRLSRLGGCDAPRVQPVATSEVRDETCVHGDLNATQSGGDSSLWHSLR